MNYRTALLLATAALSLPVLAENAPNGSDSWSRYERAHAIAEGWRQELRQREMLRLMRRQEYLQRKDHSERDRERARIEERRR
jgi:hypothetical protein